MRIEKTTVTVVTECVIALNQDDIKVIQHVADACLNNKDLSESAKNEVLQAAGELLKKMLDEPVETGDVKQLENKNAHVNGKPVGAERAKTKMVKEVIVKAYDESSIDSLHLVKQIICEFQPYTLNCADVQNKIVMSEKHEAVVARNIPSEIATQMYKKFNDIADVSAKIVY